MPDLTIDSFVDDVAKRSNIDPSAAETAVGTILSVIQQEANSSTVTQLFDHLPGAADLARKHAVVAGSGSGMGGALSGLAGKFMGANAGIMVAAMAQIEQTGLSMDQITEHRWRPSVVYQGCRSCAREDRLVMPFLVCATISLEPERNRASRRPVVGRSRVSQLDHTMPRPTASIGGRADARVLVGVGARHVSLPSGTLANPTPAELFCVRRPPSLWWGLFLVTQGAFTIFVRS